MRFATFLLLAFLLLGLAYSAATPIFETPDELQHYAHVNYVARYGRFPPLGERPGEYLWDQQALQAPLFYWLAAAATAWVDTSDFSRQAVLQPKANIGDATLPGKKNAFLHGPDQSFPYRGTTLAVHICRWVSVLLGMGTLLLTFAMGRLVFARTDEWDQANQKTLPLHPLHPLSARTDWLSGLAAAMVAFIPQFLFINASCSNDPAITFTSTLTLFLLMRAARSGITTGRAVLIGLAMGLMALSKLTGTALAVVAMVLVLVMARRVSAGLVAGAIFTAVAGGWYVYNQAVYGDPLALGAFLRFVGGNLGLPSLSADSVWGQYRLLRFSTWGLFGHISILIQPEWIYLIYDLLAAFGLAAFGLLAARRLFTAMHGRGPASAAIQFASANRGPLIALVWLAAVLALGARWFLAAGIQGRLIFPGVPAGAVLWVYGLDEFRRRWLNRFSERSMALGLSVPMAAFAAVVVPAYLVPAYSPPPVVANVPAEITHTGITFGDEIALRGYTIAREDSLLHLTFYWDTLQAPSANYTLAIRLVRSDGSLWLDYVNYPGMGTTLPATWKPGELRKDEYVFDITRFPPPPDPLRLVVGYFDGRVREMIAVGGWDDVREPGWATLADVDLK